MSDMTWDELVKAYGFPGEPLVECAEHEAVLVARKMNAERMAATPEEDVPEEEARP